MFKAYFIAVAMEWNTYMMVGCLLEWTYVFIRNDSFHASFGMRKKTDTDCLYVLDSANCLDSIYSLHFAKAINPLF